MPVCQESYNSTQMLERREEKHNEWLGKQLKLQHCVTISNTIISWYLYWDRSLLGIYEYCIIVTPTCFKKTYYLNKFHLSLFFQFSMVSEGLSPMHVCSPCPSTLRTNVKLFSVNVKITSKPKFWTLSLSIPPARLRTSEAMDFEDFEISDWIKLQS